jgi:L-lactate dehydrogenase (cytochrome)
MKAASTLDYRELAKKRLPHFLFEYLDGGSYAEVTARRNIEDLAGIALRQRILCDVSELDLSIKLFGQTMALPLVLGPVGLAGLNARRGEVQAARAAEAAGIPFTLSTVSVCTLEEVQHGIEQPFWFQLYMIRDRKFLSDLLTRARDVGCTTLVMTVDMPVPGSRYRDVRSGLAGAPGLGGATRRVYQSMLRPRWAWDVGMQGRPHSLGNIAEVLGKNTGLEDFFGWMRDNFDPSVDWDDLDYIRKEWTGTLLIKGILDPEDAREAVRRGVDGIIVSNHGGRQLDGVPSTVNAFPPIVEAVGDCMPVLVDGGIRSGLDVVRMLAIGAKAVLLGRVWAYALAADGQAGVAHMLKLIEAEMRVAMALTGVNAIAKITPDILVDAQRGWASAQKGKGRRL